MAQKQILIRVGHSAYKGTNRMHFCFSKAQAVRVLRHRGVTRDEARNAVNKAMRETGATVYGDYSEVVEIVNEEQAMRLGYFLHPYKQLRAKWAHVPEV